jgi:hypothetical protein
MNEPLSSNNLHAETRHTFHVMITTAEKKPQKKKTNHQNLQESNLDLKEKQNKNKTKPSLKSVGKQYHTHAITIYK